MKIQILGLLSLIWLFIPGAGLLAQTASPSPAPSLAPGTSPAASLAPGVSPTPSPIASALQPVPYKANEFPQWSNDLRRGEIITVGSFPIAYLFSSLFFDLGRWIVKYGNGDPDYSRYTPFSANKPDNTTAEVTGLVVAAVSVSVVVAIIDYVAGQSQAADRKRQEKAKKAATTSDFHIQEVIEPIEEPQPPSDQADAETSGPNDQIQNPDKPSPTLEPSQ